MRRILGRANVGSQMSYAEHTNWSDPGSLHASIGELNKMVRLVSIFAALIFLCGCAAKTRDIGPLAPSTCAWQDWGFLPVGEQFVVGPMDSKTNRFPTSFVIPPEDLVVSKEFSVERFKQRLYVMVVDAGRRDIILPTFMDSLLCRPVKRTFVDGYERHSRSIERRYSGGAGKPEIDAFFQKSFQEIGFFDQVLVIPQDDFEKIIRPRADKRRAAYKERLHQLQLEHAKLKRRYEDGAIEEGEYARKQQKIADEQFDIFVAKRDPIFTNPAGLIDVQEYYGDHLVVGIVARLGSGQRLDVDLRILDPVTRDIVFHARSSGGWRGKSRAAWDQCVLYPLFNAFIDWVEKNSVSTGIES